MRMSGSYSSVRIRSLCACWPGTYLYNVTCNTCVLFGRVRTTALFRAAFCQTPFCPDSFYLRYLRYLSVRVAMPTRHNSTIDIATPWLVRTYYL